MFQVLIFQEVRDQQQKILDKGHTQGLPLPAEMEMVRIGPL